VPPPRGPVVPGPVPTFSIVVPAYEVADLIAEALDSVFAQTLAPREVIVCDDGSTDALDEALAPYAGRIALLRQPNRGVASAFNAAVAAASGEFVVLLGPDDVFAPDRLEALGELAAARPDLDILTTDALVELDGAVFEPFYRADTLFETDDQRRGILRSNFVFGLAAVRRSRLAELGGFDESLESCSDWEIFIRLVLDGSRAGLVATPLATYRLRHGSISSSRARFLRGRTATIAKTLARPDLADDEREILRGQLTDNRAELVRLAAKDALEARKGARRAAARVVVGPAQPFRSRIKAVVAVVAPSLARAAARAARGRAPGDPVRVRAARE
jgi:glycosyltransferase involved in cell wall biosynthesis